MDFAKATALDGCQGVPQSIPLPDDAQGAGADQHMGSAVGKAIRRRGQTQWRIRI